MTTLFGIRHHGPGCARSLVAALNALRPDLVLIEGPPDADALIPVSADPAIRPPVAILVYDAQYPQRSAFYPFADFSPEWQAMRWATLNQVPVQFLDLPCTHRFALEAEAQKTRDDAAATAAAATTVRDAPTPTPESASALAPEPETEPISPREDPLSWLARADGYSDGERWWNDRVEERVDDAEFFTAVNEALTALRTELALPETPHDLRREAWMRRGIRQAEKFGATNIAVVCGAWHVPALQQKVKIADDNALLQGLPKTKVCATWVPWTYERLATASGYGAGVESPGWYDHLWHRQGDPTVGWITKAARVLRQADVSASSASSIEAVRLAQALAGMRGRPAAGLPETMQAMQAVFCEGNATVLGLLRRPLLIGERLGELPPDTAQLPLQSDIKRQQKTLRLKPAASETNLQLDLRESGGRARSVFLHRLLALRINWGRKVDARSGKGTFKEHWVLKWDADLVLAIIDAASYGNTLVLAAETRLVRSALTEPGLENLVPLLEHALLADLPAAAHALLARVQAVAAGLDHPPALLRAIAPLARLARYGNVRDTDLDQVRLIVIGLATRAHVELPSATSGLADEAAADLATLMGEHDQAIRLIEDPDLTSGWLEVTGKVVDLQTAHPLLRGLCTRLQRDCDAMETDAVATHLSHALSAGHPPQVAAAWLDGFLSGGGAVLMHDVSLLSLLHNWLTHLPAEQFQAILPLVRRTFSAFTAPERGQIGHAVAHLRIGSDGTTPAHNATSWTIDEPRARPALDLVTRLLNLDSPPS